MYLVKKPNWIIPKLLSISQQPGHFRCSQENELVWQKICKNEGEQKPSIVNMKNEGEIKTKTNFFWIEAKKNEYIRTWTIEGTKKNEFIGS
jgi:hypothetical protein